MIPDDIGFADCITQAIGVCLLSVESPQGKAAIEQDEKGVHRLALILGEAVTSCRNPFEALVISTAISLFCRDFLNLVCSNSAIEDGVLETMLKKFNSS